MERSQPNTPLVIALAGARTQTSAILCAARPDDFIHYSPPKPPLSSRTPKKSPRRATTRPGPHPRWPRAPREGGGITSSASALLRCRTGWANWWSGDHGNAPPAEARRVAPSPCSSSAASHVVAAGGVRYLPRLVSVAVFWSPAPRVLEARWRRRDTVVRSDVVAGGAATAAAGDSARTMSEAQVASKIRGVCFYLVTAIAAIFLFVAMVVVHPFVLLFDRYRRRAQHYIAKIWAALTISMFYKLEVEGMENLPPNSSPAVYVANHQSFLDIYTLLTLGRCFKFISKTSIFMFPIIGWAMYLLGVIPLRRMDSRSQLDCLKRCVDLVGKGASVFFFPEGTRSRDGKLGVFKRGAFSVATKTGAPVIPITLIGTGKLMPSGMEGSLNSGSVKVIIHQPIRGNDTEALCSEARNVIAHTLLRHGNGVH